MEQLKRYRSFVQIILILAWLEFLVDSTSYYIPYLTIGMSGAFCIYFNWKDNRGFRKNKENIGTVFLAMLYSTIVLMANYSMLSASNYPGKAGRLILLVHMCILFLGGYFSIWNILILLADKVRSFTWAKKQYNWSPATIFLVSMAAVSIVYLAFLFFAKYPGTLTSDSISQIEQIQTGSYSNNHPFYHTMLIKLFLSIGMALFGDINAAVALYSLCQILFMSSCIAFTMLTLYQIHIPLKLIAFSLVWYVAMPFHIMYSFTMWKNIVFSGMMLLFLVAVYRILGNIGKIHFINYLLAVISGIGVGIFQSNGLFAFLLSFICFSFLFYKKQKKLIFLLLGIIISTYALKHPVLSYFGCRETDIVAAISIPAQQIARVVADGGELTIAQEELLAEIIDIDQIAENYRWFISDPIKKLLYTKGNQAYLLENKEAYIKLYIEIGLAHPKEYVKAWIDQTKGYWNGGYAYWRWADVIDENQFGIHRTVHSESMNRLLNQYLWVYMGIAPLHIFVCIGFYVWVIVVLSYICILRRNKEGLFLCVGNLAVIISLLLSTPVYSEFRYAYAIFCCIPLLIFTTFCEVERK